MAPPSDRDGVESKARANGAAGGSRDTAGAETAGTAETWANSNRKGNGAAATPTPTPTGRDKPRASPRRVGTYERERQQRCSVLHYLTLATTPQRLRAAASPADGAEARATAAADAANDAASPPPPPATSATIAHPDGATAAALLATMRERPWEGRPSTGTAQDWAEWLEHLDPTLERHLRWLVVDGLAMQSNRDGGKEARFVAVQPPSPAGPAGPTPPAAREEEEDDDTVEPGGQASAGRLAAPVTGGKAAAAGGASGPGADTLATSSSMLAGGVRIMKSRPIKMVKPWR